MNQLISARAAPNGGPAGGLRANATSKCDGFLHGCAAGTPNYAFAICSLTTAPAASFSAAQDSNLHLFPADTCRSASGTRSGWQFDRKRIPRPNYLDSKSMRSF